MVREILVACRHAETQNPSAEVLHVRCHSTEFLGLGAQIAYLVKPRVAVHGVYGFTLVDQKQPNFLATTSTRHHDFSPAVTSINTPTQVVVLRFPPRLRVVLVEWH